MTDSDNGARDTGVGDDAADRIESQAEMWVNRVRKNKRALRRWVRREGIEAYRIYDRDIPELPFAVDVYGDSLHISEYRRAHGRGAAEHARWLDTLVQTLAVALEVEESRVHLKRRERQQGLSQYERFASEGAWGTVQEGGLQFRVNLSDYLDTGLFLDHRVARGWVRERASGCRVLNLFSYTGAFSVYAAAGGALRVDSVDLSKTYTAWAAENFALNGQTSEVHNLLQCDAMTFAREAGRRGPFYDVAIVDPPTFSNSKRTENDFDVQRSHGWLLTDVLLAMQPGGVVYFSTNFRSFRLDVPTIERLATIEDVSHASVPRDFRDRRVHRCWMLERRT